MRYRPTSSAPGRKRPSSSADDEVSCEISDAAEARADGATTVSTDVGVGSRSIGYDSTAGASRDRTAAASGWKPASRPYGFGVDAGGDLDVFARPVKRQRDFGSRDPATLRLM